MKINKSSMGFTLVELIIVVGIIGILAGVGYPAYMNSVNKGMRADGIDGLVSLAGAMEEYYLNNDTYVAADIATLIGSTTTGEGRYTLSFNAAPTAFAYDLVATPVNGDPDCGNLTLSSLGVKGVTAVGATVAQCW